jgi:hypothetical protein
MNLDVAGIGSVADLAKGLVDRFFPPSATPQERAMIELQIQQTIDARESVMLNTQKAIITSEMAQGDDYTKRARPSIVYFGLLFIGLIHVILPMVSWITGKGVPDINLPAEFWYTWSGVCSVWCIGRTAEKFGKNGKIVSAITGCK